MFICRRSGVKATFHDTDIDTDILARILATMSVSWNAVFKLHECICCYCGTQFVQPLECGPGLHYSVDLRTRTLNVYGTVGTGSVIMENEISVDIRTYLYSVHGTHLLFEVSIVVDVCNDEVQVVLDAETIFDAAHRRRQRVVGQVHAYRYDDTCSALQHTVSHSAVVWRRQVTRVL